MKSKAIRLKNAHLRDGRVTDVNVINDGAVTTFVETQHSMTQTRGDFLAMEQMLRDLFEVEYPSAVNQVIKQLRKTY
jgi:hypothetical protein